MQRSRETKSQVWPAVDCGDGSIRSVEIISQDLSLWVERIFPAIACCCALYFWKLRQPRTYFAAVLNIPGQ